MLFLQATHSRYHNLLSQFATKHKDLSIATIDSVVADAQYMDDFMVVGRTKQFTYKEVSLISKGHLT
jgi:hypothetical protein